MKLRDILKSKVLIFVLCSVTILISAIVALGWVINDTDFIYLFSVKHPVRFDSAICLILLGLAIILNQTKINPKVKNFYSALIAIFPLIIGLITLAEFIFHVQLMDEMFIVSDYFAKRHSSMSLNNTINIILISTAVIFINNRYKSFAYYPAFIALAISMMGIVGYKLDEPLFISLGASISTSLLATGLILIIILCIFLSQPYKSIMSIVMSETVGGYLARRWIPIAVSIPIIAILLKPALLNWFHIYNVNIGISLISLVISALIFSVVLYSSYKLYLVDLKRKESELTIIKLNTELEEKVVKRTNELNLINKELEAFTYSVSHDLRAPLRSIDGFSKILYDEYKDDFKEESLEYLIRVRKSSQKMAKLIEDLLKLSRISQRELHKKEFNLTTLIRNIYDEFNFSTNGHDIFFNIEGNMIIKADEDLIKIAITNLLDNAFKFSKCRDKIIVDVGSTKKDNKKVYFIKDNGVGFDMTYKDKLFTAFQRLHTSKDYEGIGIGLAIAKRIFLKHGGDIFAEAEMDNGAVFYFYI